MLLIFVPKLTNRLGYTINVVMRDLLQTEFAITNDANKFLQHHEASLCYGSYRIGGAEVPFIKSCHLLFETVIEEQKCRCFDFDGTPAMFPVFGKDAALPFDVFAAIFFMVSRYEEYLPHRADAHGRFPASESTAFRHGFLQKAVVDRWALLVRDIILRHYPDTVFKPKTFNVVQTIDIDSAYCYRHKGLFRTSMGCLRDGFKRRNPKEVVRRLRVLCCKEADPFDTFDYILEQQAKQQHGDLIFFTLIGDYGLYDKPASYNNYAFRNLIQHLGDFAKVGLHGSYFAGEEADRLSRETERLADILHRPIVRNRFHFLRFTLPNTYRLLVQHDIRHDYSMGFADQPGFRCGTSCEIPFYDLGSDQETPLHIHPLVVMDTTLKSHLGLSTEESKQTIHAIADEVRATNGTFCCLFHNQNLCDDFGWEGWREVYEDTLSYVCRN